MPPKPKPTKASRPKKRKAKNRRKELEKQIEMLVKLIIQHRDHNECVMSAIDAAHCGGSLQWNHVIAQSKSNWLRLDLGNVVWGCEAHNRATFYHDEVLKVWYTKFLGQQAFEALWRTAKEYAALRRKRTVQELEELLIKYQGLYEDRYLSNTMRGNIENGMYGDIVKENY